MCFAYPCVVGCYCSVVEDYDLDAWVVCHCCLVFLIMFLSLSRVSYQRFASAERSFCFRVGVYLLGSWW